MPTRNRSESGSKIDKQVSEKYLDAGAADDESVAPPDQQERGAGADAAEGVRKGNPYPDGVAVEIVEAFERELSEARRVADENHDRYLRAEADLQNLRRRAEQRRQEAAQLQKRELLFRFLEVADNLERGLVHAADEEGPLVEGLKATWRSLEHLLEREGVARMETEGATFNPELHEAIATVDVPGAAEESIVSVEHPGYTLNGELLRPARVVVARGAS